MNDDEATARFKAGLAGIENIFALHPLSHAINSLTAFFTMGLECINKNTPTTLSFYAGAFDTDLRQSLESARKHQLKPAAEPPAVAAAIAAALEEDRQTMMYEDDEEQELGEQIDGMIVRRAFTVWPADLTTNDDALGQLERLYGGQAVEHLLHDMAVFTAAQLFIAGHISAEAIQYVSENYARHFLSNSEFVHQSRGFLNTGPTVAERLRAGFRRLRGK